ncbi:MAG TPA: FtsX-like permease family protein [Actinomycetes bacterium]|jgi:putative ABC transport system permease protein|nr:FtsX-like permease family protein [Actinomycetes bacterium]
MWLIARRTAAQQWRRLLATLATVALTVGLVAGSALLGQQARTAGTRIRATEYARTAVIVRASGAVIPGTDPSGAPAESRADDGRLGADVAGQVATVPGVAAVAGDAAIPADLVGADHKVVTPSGGAPTLLRPWVADPSLSTYRLVAGRAPAAAGEVAVVRSLARAGRLQVGATTTLILPQDIQTVRVVGIVTVDGADAAARGAMVLAPSRGVQQAAGLERAWPVLMVGAAAATDPSILHDRIQRALHGDGVVALGADIARQQIEAAKALGSSIAALLLILVFVGVFVAASAFSTLVRRRVRLLALLEVVGATPRQVRRLVRLEALLIGAGACVAGLRSGSASPACWPGSLPRSAWASTLPASNSGRSMASPRRWSACSPPSSPPGPRHARRPGSRQSPPSAPSIWTARLAPGHASSPRPSCSSARPRWYGPHSPCVPDNRTPAASPPSGC